MILTLCINLLMYMYIVLQIYWKNMDVHPFISQHETHFIISNTRQNQDEEDNKGNIGKDIHNGIIHDIIVLTEVEAQQEISQDWPWEQRHIQCNNNAIGYFVRRKL